MQLERTKSGFTISADDLAALLEVDHEDVRRMMRDGSLTTRFEKGVDEDCGRYRLSFITPDRRIRLLVDEAGRVLQRIRTTSTAPSAGTTR